VALLVANNHELPFLVHQQGRRWSIRERLWIGMCLRIWVKVRTTWGENVTLWE
jgi:hypothetical protein